MMAAYFEIDPGVVVDEHSHPNEQMGILMKGTIRWNIRGTEKTTHAPALYRIPSQVPHKAEIIGDEPAVLLDVYHPIREDFLKEGPAQYFKGTSSE
jgi:quercetin dioxygenase-like cupin family protein